jgi:hypothetical protein
LPTKISIPDRRLGKEHFSPSDESYIAVSDEYYI